MATAWTAYFPDVMPHVPGCPYGMVVNAVRNAAIELAHKSLILRSSLAAINVVVDQQDYTLTPPANTRVVTPISVRFDSIPITATGEETMDHVHPYWREGGISRRYYMAVPGTLSLTWVPKTAITGGLEVRIAYKPAETSSSGDDLLYDDWASDIAAGALAELLDTADQSASWRNPEAARSWASRFARGVHNASFRARMGHGYQAPMLKMRPW